MSIHRLYSSSPPLTNPLEPLVHGSNELPHPRLDYRNIADNVVYKSTNAINRKAPLPANAVQSVVRSYTESKRISTSLNAKRSERAAIGETIRNAPDPEAKQRVLETGKRLKEEIAELESQLAIIDTELLEVALAIPNDTHPSAPLGPEEAAITISTQGPDPLPPSPERDHVEICRKLGLLDLASGASVTGSSWYYLMNEAALLEIALTNYALSVAIRNGFTPVMTPDVVRSDIAKRCGFQPRDQADPPVSQMYHLESPVTGSSSSELVLSGTAEIPLAGMFANKIFPPTNLPLKVVGVGKAFRAEAGARGADTRGLYRVHQFSKVELFAVTTAEQSEEVMEDMAKLQMSILSGLGFPFRYLMLSVVASLHLTTDKLRTEYWICQRRNWEPVHIENMIWRPGCLDAVNGAKFPRSRIVQTTKRADS